MSECDLYCVTTAMLHYAKGVAHAATGDLAAADEQRRLFREAYARVPDTRYLFNNTCLDALAVAAEMLDGEIEYRHGRYDAAFAHLRRSVEIDDNLLYDEPWAWMQPTRHALGALLLEQGHVEQAEAVYRADLGLDSTLSRPCQHPDNVTYSQIAKAAFQAFDTRGSVRFLRDKPDIPDNVFPGDDALYEAIRFCPSTTIEDGLRRIAALS